MDSLKTVLRECISSLKARGIENAAEDALSLVCFSLNLSNHVCGLDGERMITKVELKKIASLIGRRANHEPVSKIIGKKLFWNSSFCVNKNVLDPRPETEVLVDCILRNIGAAKTILELGTGSGCIAISLSLMLPKVKVVASDVSPQALDVARLNAHNNDAEVEFILSSWFENIAGNYDIIVANPPYIANCDFSSLPKDVKDYDPQISLLGGNDGFDCYRTISTLLGAYLTTKGLGFFEIGLGQKEAVINIFSKSGFSLVRVWKDLNNLDRVICVKKDA